MRSFREAKSVVSLSIDRATLSIPLARFCEYEPHYQSSFRGVRVYQEKDDGTVTHYFQLRGSQGKDVTPASKIREYLNRFEFYESKEKLQRMTIGG